MKDIGSGLWTGGWQAWDSGEGAAERGLGLGAMLVLELEIMLKKTPLMVSSIMDQAFLILRAFVMLSIVGSGT